MPHVLRPSATFQVSVHRLPEFTSVKLSGHATIEDFVHAIRSVAAESKRLGDRRMLVDQLGIPNRLKFTDHFRIGEEVAAHLRHLDKLASVVPPDKITHTSEKVALQQGFQLRVFTSMREAIRWLRGSDCIPPLAASGDGE